MFSPETEARFRRIEDDLAVTAELQRHAEMRSKDDSEHLHAVQDAMARWMDRMADKQDEYEAKLNALIAVQMELSRIMDRFLRARTNGGEN